METVSIYEKEGRQNMYKRVQFITRLNLQGGPWQAQPNRIDPNKRVKPQCDSLLCIFSPRGVWLYYTFSYAACQVE